MTSLRSREAFIEWATTLEGGEWRRLCIKMAWFYRKGGERHQAPSELEYLADLVKAKPYWHKVCKAVRIKRRALYKERVKREAVEKKDKRRKYMREYMTEYRKH